MNESSTILTPASAQAEDARQAGAESLNGHPDWTPVFDYDPAQAIKSRRAILDRAATDRIMVLGYHFPFPALGHVVRRDTAYRWEAAQWAW